METKVAEVVRLLEYLPEDTKDIEDDEEEE